jgi:hypothetical protein
LRGWSGAKNLATFRAAVNARFNYEMVMRREFSRLQPAQAFPPELCKLPPVLQGLHKGIDAEFLERMEAKEAEARKELGDDTYELATAGKTATVDGFMDELEVRERLNAMIDRCLKRLLLVKGLESFLASSSALAPKRLVGPRTAPARAKRSMPVRAKKSHPALKHGGYAATIILPGESVAAFEKLHRDLMADFTADGALEADIVADLAGRLWRKQNLATFRAAKVARKRYDEITDRHVNPYDGIVFHTEADIKGPFNSEVQRAC